MAKEEKKEIKITPSMKDKPAESEPEEPTTKLSVAKDLLEHIYQTDEKRLAEMTILRQRLIHGLTTMQAWEKEFFEIVEQIRRYQAWWCLQKTATMEGNKKQYNEQEAKELYTTLIAEDKVEAKELFSNVWRLSLYQHARSEEGKHLEGARQLEEGIIATQQTEAEDNWGQPQ